MPNWHLWDPSLGRAGARIPRLPNEAEQSGDGKWANVWKDGVSVATFVAMPTRAEIERVGYRPSRRLASGTDRRRPE